MGVDAPMFLRLADLSRRIDPPRRALMLGRQKFADGPKLRRLYNDALTAAGHEARFEDLSSPDGYAERALAALGFGEVESLDYSDFEGAAHTHDLNLPVPAKLKSKFDLIIDAGTLEHVFNLPQALANVFDMLRSGGVFVACNPFNGWPAHGLYQFGPELVWTFWRRAAGCEVMNCMMLPKRPRLPSLDLPDQAEKGHRLRLKGRVPEGRVYLYYEVRKTRGAKLGGSTLSGDYTTIWSRADAAEPVRAAS